MKMKTNTFKILLLLGFTALSIVVIILVLLTYAIPQTATENFFLEKISHYHFEFMILSFIIALVLGVIWTKGLESQISEKDKKLHHLTKIVLQFLSKEEREVIEHLIEYGSIKQSEIGYIHNMGRVKAMRTVQKLELRKLVVVEPFGKQRIVRLVI